MPQSETTPQKHNVKCLFISKLHPESTLFDLAILTDSFQFFQCEVTTRSNGITANLWLKMRKALMPFQISSTTDIMVSDTVSPYDPMYFYFKILQEHIHFNMRSVAVLQIPKRIATYHPTYLNHKKLDSIRKPDIERLWTKIVENSDCPWITKSIDIELKSSYSAYRYRQQFLRLAVYYMLIKQHFYTKFKNSRGYKNRMLEKTESLQACKI